MPENLTHDILANRNLPSTPESYKEPWEREVDGIYNAMLFMHQKARRAVDGGLDRLDILDVHKIVMNDPFNPEKTGVLRDLPVIVRGKVNGEVKDAAFTPSNTESLSGDFDQFAAQLEEKTSNLSAETPISDVIDTASWAHSRFIEIHPFEDGNGRTARLIVDFIFRRSRLPYIRDWGARGDEYMDVVYKIYDEDNLDLLKQFLAKKLDSRLIEIEKQPPATGNGDFSTYVKKRKTETEAYIASLQNGS